MVSHYKGVTMDSAAILKTALDIVRKKQSFVHMTPSSRVTSEAGLAMAHTEFSEGFPHLFAMCMSICTDEDADSLRTFLPLMLQQRDKVSHRDGNAAALEAATATIVQTLNKTYIDPHIQ